MYGQIWISLKERLVSTESVIVCLGPRTPGFLEAHGFYEHGLWNQLIEVVRFTSKSVCLDEVPCFYDDLLDINGRHCPLTRGLYVGHTTHIKTDNATTNRDLRAGHARRVRELARDRFGFLQSAQAQGGLCHVDCYSGSGVGQVSFLDGAPDGLAVVTGFRGGGYKMAPYAAGVLADLLIG